MPDKTNDHFLTFCNECNWEEENKGLPYKFCPKCGHVNIGFHTTRKATHGTVTLKGKQ